ncbi:MAG: RBBP9/YdeN family alpha/beta hydrolase [Candidatus Paceibacteria bacterium]
MQKRVFIIHGWNGQSDEGGFPWLQKELEERGFEVHAPQMPEPAYPKIDAWISHLKEQISIPDENTYLLGHSIGAQTILRYLESLEPNAKIGGAVFLAGWMHLTNEAYEDEGDIAIAKPWLETPIDWEKVKLHTDKFTAIFSDDDPFVPFSDSEIFADKLNAKIIVENNKGHFSGVDGIKELPIVLSAILEMSNTQ